MASLVASRMPPPIPEAVLLRTWLKVMVRKPPLAAPGVERRREHLNATRAVPRPAIDRALTRRDVPLREKTLWRMLYETAARASEVLALNIEDPGLDARRAPVRSKGGGTEWICWGSGTAHLLPRLIRGRLAGPVFGSERRPGPARRPAAGDLCPVTGRARLGYDRARILFTRHTGRPGHARPASVLGNRGHWRFATDGDSSAVAGHAISADLRSGQGRRSGS